MTAPTISQSGRRAVTLTGVEVRTAGDGGVVVRGHAAVFDTPTMIGPVGVGFEEVVAPGAFAKTLADGADVRFLFNHNPDLVLARTKSGTLKLHEDRVGLAVEAQLAPTSVGRDLAILLERGDVSQMSFGFRVVKDKWDTVKRSDGITVERRTVLEAQLLDVSGVTYPAYDETDLALREATLARELRDARTPKTSEEPAPATPPDPPQGDSTTTSDPGQSGVASSEAPKPAAATPVPDEPTNKTAEQRSMSVSNTLYDERARIWHKMKELLAETEGRTMSGEEEHSWQNMEADLDRCNRSIAIQEKGKQLGEMLEAPGDAPVSTRGADNASHPATPFHAANTPAGRAASTATVPGDIQRSYDFERAFGEYLRRGLDGMRAEHRDLLERENRDQSVGTNTAGGFTVPPGFSNRVVEAMKAWGGMLDAATVIDTDTGAPLQWPTVDDTGNTGAIVSENTVVTAQDVTFGSKSLGAFMYTSKLVKVSLQLLQDTGFDLDGFLARAFARRIGTAINAHFTVGTGGGTQPAGMIPNLTVGRTGAAGSVTSLGAGGATNAAYLETVELEHSIDPAYRANAAYMMNDASLKVFRRILDADGKPIWQPSMQQGVPGTINGYPYIINQDMPVMAANAKSIAFGDFKQAYLIRRARGMQTLRLNERYADALQVGFLAFARYDGVVNDANAAKVFQNAAV